MARSIFSYRWMCVGTWKPSRITSRYFKLPDSRHRSERPTEVVKNYTEKCRNLIRLPYHPPLQLPAHTRAVLLPFEFGVTFRVLATTLHPTPLSLSFSLPFNLLSFPSLYPLFLKSKLLPSLPFSEVLTLLSLCPRVFLSLSSRAHIERYFSP